MVLSELDADTGASDEVEVADGVVDKDVARIEDAED